MLLYQCFVILLPLSFCAVLFSFCFFACKIAISKIKEGNDIPVGHPSVL